jgi:hypothetical protein
MEPIYFPESNKNLLKPAGMTDKQCGSLPVLSDGKICLSLWRTSWRERLSVLFFGRVWLYVYSGHTQPPVSLNGTRSVFGKGEEA